MDSNKAISSDDPDALEMLRENLAQMEAQQEYMKAANKLVRKVPKIAALTFEEQVTKLVELAQAKDLNITTKIAEGLLTKDFCGRKGFPDYRLKNNNANMRRVRERIAELEQQHARIAEQGDEETTEYPELGLEVVHNNVLNRIQLVWVATEMCISGSSITSSLIQPAFAVEPCQLNEEFSMSGFRVSQLVQIIDPRNLAYGPFVKS